MPRDCSRIEALWVEPGTPFDAAAAANKHRPRDKQITHRSVLRIWEKAQDEGRLPPFWRPWAGFRKNQADILRRFMEVGMRGAA